MLFTSWTSNGLMQRLVLSFLMTSLPFGAVPAEVDSPTNARVQLRVDAGQVEGKIRPLHSSNGGPIACGGMVDTSRWHKEAGFPLMRLHDCQWPEPAVVDIHTIFRDFRDDPQDPSNYYFARTDDYLEAIVKTGAGIFYRLGESIEHSQRKYDVHPPKDYDKWAQICLGIIRHYNEGWAEGFHHNIQYWEIWNEPEIRPQMWSGTDEDYYRLYALTAKAIKERFPNLKVGGPAAANAGSFRDGQFEPAPFVAGWLKYCRAQSAPVDFFSWHVYSSDPQFVVNQAGGVRQMLNRFGFAKAESHLDEWNYLPRNDWNVFSHGTPAEREQWYREMTGPTGAAFTACTLMGLQDAPLDMAYFYTSEPQGFGLFSQYGEPRKSFYAIKAFRQLLDTPNRVRCSGARGCRLNLLAGADERNSRLNVLVSNFQEPPGAVDLTIAAIPWSGRTRCEIIEIGPESNWKLAQSIATGQELKLSFALDPGSIRLIELSRFEVDH
jgi:xylan 1,4-beta-xylosidase